MVGVTRKRVAHDPGVRILSTGPPKKPFRPSPSQQLAMRQEALRKAREQAEGTPQATMIPHLIPSEQRKQRISTNQFIFSVHDIKLNAIYYKYPSIHKHLHLEVDF